MPEPLAYRSEATRVPPRPSCLGCGTGMQQGIMLTNPAGTRNTTGRLLWVVGETRRGWFGLLRFPRGRRLEVITFRCANCGLLENYTPAGVVD